MCAGTQILEVDVHSDCSGTVVLKASCRDEAISLQSGESVQIVREKDAETCGVAVDFRGHGRSEKTELGHIVAQYARDIHTFLEHRDLEDVVLVGWSLGALVSWVSGE
ncbi:alpha/beta hydrolase [Halomicroarcula pellucida]|uniref:AB hydrolase-1 domain-containing protein n=1 Tax=Haloarcula pellucida TaxID=1427151 RepID=A0A830GNV3_9EURY|nr:alpha/beta hydrolase [Halomicroarcula pellucida]GGN95736.1 hypothetical protein GCM10009030_23240 [Halomicroarcula pellucida]